MKLIESSEFNMDFFKKSRAKRNCSQPSAHSRQLKQKSFRLIAVG
jgi:hypothetical protein